MRISSLTTLVVAMLSPFAFAQTDTVQAADTAQAPVLVELFTSQACSSCPKAERLFAEFAERDDLVVIQWHVDYWDNLVHGRDGRWKDPYSSSDNTQRQRDYNYALRGTGSVYTPQAVVAGVSEATGSRRRRVENMIRRAPAPYAQIDMSVDANGLMVAISTASDSPTPADQEMLGAEVMMVELLTSDSNEILGGENRGLTANSRNVAISHDTLGAWSGQMETYRARTVDASNSCAVIVQEQDTGRILGASYCPPMPTQTSEDEEPGPREFIRGHP